MKQLTDNLLDLAKETLVIKIPKHPADSSVEVKQIKGYSFAGVIVNNASRVSLSISDDCLITPYECVNVGGNLWMATREAFPCDIIPNCKLNIRVEKGNPKELLYIPRKQDITIGDSYYFTNILGSDKAVTIKQSGCGNNLVSSILEDVKEFNRSNGVNDNNKVCVLDTSKLLRGNSIIVLDDGNDDNYNSTLLKKIVQDGQYDNLKNNLGEHVIGDFGHLNDNGRSIFIENYIKSNAFERARYVRITDKFSDLYLVNMHNCNQNTLGRGGGDYGQLVFIRGKTKYVDTICHIVSNIINNFKSLTRDRFIEVLKNYDTLVIEDGCVYYY